jgi:hypothetical protein
LSSLLKECHGDCITLDQSLHMAPRRFASIHVPRHQPDHGSIVPLATNGVHPPVTSSPAATGLCSI